MNLHRRLIDTPQFGQPEFRDAREQPFAQLCAGPARIAGEAPRIHLVREPGVRNGAGVKGPAGSELVAPH